MTTILRELSSAEKRKSYAEYFYRPMTPPPQDTVDILNKGPVDPALALALAPADKNRLMEPGYLPCEKGYCLMPDGTGFIAMLTDMPGVTADMLEWWFTWHGLENLRYSIWCPDDHMGVYVRPDGLARRLDTSLPVRERAWGTTDIVDEDIGQGACLLAISFQSPADYGYDMARFAPPAAAGAISANLSLYETDTPMVTFTHFIRPTQRGVEVRSRFWLGWQMVDGKPVQVSNSIPFDLVHGLAHHSPKEYANLAAILPEVYADEHEKQDRLEDFEYRMR